MLVNATHDAAFFAGDEGFGGEVVYAIIETALDEVGVHLKREGI